MDIPSVITKKSARNTPEVKKATVKIKNKPSVETGTISLDTKIIIGNQQLTIEDYILELLPNYMEDDKIKKKQLTMKIIATTDIKNAEQVKGLLEDFLER